MRNPLNSLLRLSARGRWLTAAGASALAPLGAVWIAGSPSRAQPPGAAPAGPPILFTAPLPDAPGKHLAVVRLTLPARDTAKPHPHRHPGAVLVYVTNGTARLGLEGQPVQQVAQGGTFYEPEGALHTVAESADARASATVIAVIILPDGAPLVL